MRIFICGQKDFGAQVFERMLQLGHTVAGIAVPMDPADALYRRVYGQPLHVVQAGTLRADLISKWNIDLIIAAFCHDFIGEKTRNATRYGGIGYHPSLLPRHRGRDAIEWTIRMRDPIAGGSVYWLSNRCDGGDIAAQKHCLVRPDDTSKSLYRRDLFPIGISLIAKVVTDISAGIIIRAPQCEEVATWEPSILGKPIFKPELPQLPHDADDRTKVSYLDPNSF